MIKNSILYLIMISLILLVGFVQSWNVALLILNMCIISSIMSLGVNIQYGYAGLFNLGIMGFVALGGLATVIISAPPVYEAWEYHTSQHKYQTHNDQYLRRRPCVLFL